MDTTTLYLGLFFSAVGMGYFVYGKNQGKVIALLAGIALMISPFFSTSPLVLSLVCLILMAVPVIAARRWD